MRSKVILALGAIGMLLLIRNLYVLMFLVPDDMEQGPVYRIFYYHLPAFLVAAVGYLTAMVSSMFTTHIAIHPEITFTSPTTANGKWRMQDIVHFTAPDPALIIPGIKGGEELSGVAYYHDEYLKEADGWKIAKMGYVRIFEALKRPNFIHLETTPARGKVIS